LGYAATEFLDLLAQLGINGAQITAIVGSIIGRMAGVGSELATYNWLTKQSALGELLEVDYESLPLMTMYRAADALWKHSTQIEQTLFMRLTDLFGFSTTITLYDLTNTYFEGEVPHNTKARRGRSKEKRTDCPLVTLGLVLDGSGLCAVRRPLPAMSAIAKYSGNHAPRPECPIRCPGGDGCRYRYRGQYSMAAKNGLWLSGGQP